MYLQKNQETTDQCFLHFFDDEMKKNIFWELAILTKFTKVLNFFCFFTSLPYEILKIWIVDWKNVENKWWICLADSFCPTYGLPRGRYQEDVRWWSTSHLCPAASLCPAPSLYPAPSLCPADSLCSDDSLCSNDRQPQTRASGRCQMNIEFEEGCCKFHSVRFEITYLIF